MGAWLRKLWDDEVYFEAQAVALMRFGIAGVGYLLEQGIIPTGVDGGGTKYGRALYVVALLLAAGNRTPKAKP